LWADREAVFVVLDGKTAVRGVEVQGQRAGLQGFAVVAGEERHEQLALEQRVGECH